MVEVVYTDEFAEWWDGLTAEDQKDVAVVVGLLEGRGVALGYPYSSAIKVSKFGLRELRIQSGACCGSSTPSTHGDRRHC